MRCKEHQVPTMTLLTLIRKEDNYDKYNETKQQFNNKHQRSGCPYELLVKELRYIYT